MLAFLFDPRVFNFVILALYGANVARWLVAGRPVTALYWAGAFLITSAVTWGLEH